MYIEGSMKKFLFILFITVSFLVSKEQPQKYWICFTKKDQPVLSKSATLSEISTATGITEHALRRRAKMNTAILSKEDLPVSKNFLRQLENAGITVEHISRWFNAATAYLTEQQLQTVQQFPFVKEITPVQRFRRRALSSSLQSEKNVFLKPSANQKYSYGSSLNQMMLINAVAVHNIGISGRGVLVGMLDTGFRWRAHEAMQHLNVIAEYDFIQKDSVTENQEGDRSDQDSHGTSTMSLVGGFKDGALVSPAFSADFILGKTEYVPTETNIEEDNWVAAIEWMEQQGVDVVSSSLGYSTFDAGQTSYTYQDMDGKTATTTKAAVIAMRKGVVVCNSMGNEANFPWHFLTSPADADSIISVGAVTASGNYASFSSVGPTSDGRTKPDVCAQGTLVYAAVPGKSGYSGTFSGTSASTPFVAGVAAMLLSAHPELTPVQVRDALRNTASNSASPNDSIGWGIINAYEALLYNGMVISTEPEVTLTQQNNYSIAVYVISKTPIYKDSVQLFYSINNGATFTPLAMPLAEILDTATSSGKYSAVIAGVTFGSEVQFYIRAVDNVSQKTSPYNAPHNVYNAQYELTKAIPAPLLPIAFALKQNYPNPFNSGTFISYELPVTSVVTLKVFDLLGKEVATLVNGIQRANSYTVPFNASSLSSGVYFYRLQTPTFTETKKMMLIR